ncbi:helix-turn-helix domain-containing protein [Dellaglioa algida]|uniref:helix-turn-helix domain-containing protein n=1 Tax=Dellaglioa algida TaxID=105612 RepID=UPI0024C4A445|nr:helix-turn-helix transcriptional regulator [Dellaglioa algida]MDK1716394.1 helix-turn-helix domain-containing protein [Dellaglioa algida]MDK1720252.1 helix-turn-helix domain-containing protein [Dellaglioa algida]MDK1721335.1 helix-turn-helix domain-containing protein [Dellaglioa algida]
MTTGERIKKLRKDRGLTQSELAKEIGISRSYMSEIESDKRNMSIKTLTKIATGLDISLSFLLD